MKDRLIDIHKSHDLLSFQLLVQYIGHTATCIFNHKVYIFLHAMYPNRMGYQTMV